MTFTQSNLSLRDREYAKFVVDQTGSKVGINVNLIHEPNATFSHAKFTSGTADINVIDSPNLGSQHRIWGWMLNAQADASGMVDIFLSGAATSILGSHADLTHGWNNQFTGINQVVPMTVPYYVGSPYSVCLNSDTIGTGCMVILYDTVEA